MRKWITGGAALVLAATLVAAEEKGTKYGEGVAMTSATAIADLATKPDQFVGKKVRIDGVVEAVCENMGCWMQIKDEKSDKTVRIKVDDGVIVFPVTAKGKKASAEGVFEKVDTKAEEAHHAEMEKAEAAAKPAAAAAGHDHAAMMAKAEKAAPKVEKPHVEPPPVAYHLKATGAIVY
jgi:hypothetical protein